MAIVDVIINVQYTVTTPVGLGKSTTVTNNVQIKDSVEESTVQAYIDNMTPVVSTPA
jgi:hypothetical protein